MICTSIFEFLRCWLLFGRAGALSAFNSLNFPDSHPVRLLYEHSRQSGAHSEGDSALISVCLLVRELGSERPGRCLDRKSMRARLQAMLAWSEQALLELDDLDAIVIFGSALRGKLEPADVDICLVKGGESIERHSQLESLSDSGQLCCCRLLEARFARSRVPKRIETAPISAKAIAWYDEHPYLRLKFVERCPYLALARVSSKQRGPALQGFFNCAGTAYRQGRAR